MIKFWRWFIYFGFLMLFCIPISSGWASQALLSQLEHANQAYEQEQYVNAINGYEKILAAGMKNGIVYYNLGNAYYKNNQLGKAILSYERAKRLIPRDEDINFNLEFTKTQIADRIDLPKEGFLIETYQTILSLFTLDELIQITYILYVVLVIFLCLLLILKRSRRLLNIVLVFVIMLCLVSGGFSFQKYQLEKTPRAVVMATQVNVMTGPGENLQIAFKVHEGTALSIIDTRNEWCEVLLAGKLQGWVKKEVLEVI